MSTKVTKRFGAKASFYDMLKSNFLNSFNHIESMRLFRVENRHARTCVHFASFADTVGLSFHQKSARNRS